ncbi:uncharacterized protein LOC117326521 [Pecten maximus]|uniref:uncharacterized protein LOC117326521 n=1 Tax=Pecten maximus TaxID=6579 RepID=UPI001459098E|nr:uncharacterized protein LOC117326521 [Pecten maximus]
MSALKEPYHHGHLSRECKEDILMWLEFLKDWNGISFFYERHFTDNSDFELFTDAASTVGYGGIFRTSWFASPWPKEVISAMEGSAPSMSFLELYPIVVAALVWGVLESSPSCQPSPLSLPTVLSSNVELNQTVNKLWDAATSTGTRGAYRTGFTSYKTFLLQSGVNWFSSMPPVSEDFLIYFVAHCFHVLRIKAGTIKLYLCGIRYFYLRAGFQNPLASRDGQSYVRLHTLVTGVKKVQGVSRRPRLPITYDILHRSCQLLRAGVFSPFIDIMMETACTIAFFGFLRCGEFCVSGAFDPTRNLCVEDVYYRSLTEVCTYQSKSLQITSKCVCPYLALDKYMVARTSLRIPSDNPRSPFFITDNAIPLTRNTFITNLRVILSRLGLNDSAYSGHSFRIGAATSAATSQVEDHLIKTLGRWSSDCYQRYIRTSTSSNRQAQRSMTSGY